MSRGRERVMERLGVLQQIGDPQLGTKGSAPAQVSQEGNTIRYDTHSNSSLYTPERTGAAHRIVALNSRHNTQIMYLLVHKPIDNQ